MATPISAVAFPAILEVVLAGDFDPIGGSVVGYLSNTAPAGDEGSISEVTHLAEAGGYDPDVGIPLPAAASMGFVGTQIEVIYSNILSFIPTGSVGPFQYIYIGFPALVGDPLWCVLDLGTPVTLDGSMGFGVTLGILTVLKVG